LKARSAARVLAVEWKSEQAAREGSAYKKQIVALERDPRSTEAKKLSESLRFGDYHLRGFYKKYPK
jgi:hypothetical protein